jgi:8-oxo-dGTP pyrophosphatase MutT (NUDIX family)
MKNFPIIDSKTGREHWISRSVAVVGLVFGYDEDEKEYILAVQRGTGTPDPEFVGKWCLPCGYLDYDETLEEALQREVFEETGVLLATDSIELLEVNSDPKSDKRQNITFRYKVISQSRVEDLEKEFTTKNSEKDEVDSIRFIKVSNWDLYDYAFNHEEIIKALLPKKG